MKTINLALQVHKVPQCHSEQRYCPCCCLDTHAVQYRLLTCRKEEVKQYDWIAWVQTEKWEYWSLTWRFELLRCHPAFISWLLHDQPYQSFLLLQRAYMNIAFQKQTYVNREGDLELWVQAAIWKHLSKWSSLPYWWLKGNLALTIAVWRQKWKCRQKIKETRKRSRQLQASERLRQGPLDEPVRSQPSILSISISCPRCDRLKEDISGSLKVSLQLRRTIGYT